MNERDKVFRKNTAPGMKQAGQFIENYDKIKNAKTKLNRAKIDFFPKVVNENSSNPRKLL